MSTSKNVFNPLLDEGLQIVSTTAESIAAVTLEPTGFEDPNGIGVAYSYTDRKVTLTHSSGTIAWQYRGVRHTVASPWSSVAHNVASGLYYLTINGDISAEAWSTSSWTFDQVQAAFVNRGASAALSFALRETHGVMQWQSHEEDHQTIGTYWRSGLTLDPLTYAINGTVNAQNAWGAFTGVIKDEDLSTTIPALAEGSYTMGYRSGASGDWVFSKANALPFFVETNTLQWNQFTGATWQLALTTEDNFVNYFHYAFPVASDADSQTWAHLIIPGQAQYTTLAAAQQEFPQNIDLGTLIDLSPEFVCVNRITMQFNAIGLGAKTTTGRCAIQAVTPIRGTRAAQVAVGGAAPSNHGGLSGLANDDHLQYLHINGRAAQVSSQNANFSASPDVETYVVDTSGGNITVTLPDPAVYPGKQFLFLNAGVNNIIFGGHTIGGLANFTIDGNERLLIVSDGAWKNALRKPMAYWKTGVTFCKDHIIESSEAGFEGIWRATAQHTAAAAFSTDLQAGRWEYMGGDRSALWVNKAGHGFATGEAIMRKFATNDWARSDVDSNDNEVDGVVAGATTNYFMLVTNGYIKRTSGTWLANLQYYLSTTAGALTVTKPSTGYLKRVLRTLGGTPDTTEAIVNIGELEYIDPEPSAVTTVTAGDNLGTGVVSPRWVAVIGNNTGQNALSTTPFGGSAPSYPIEIWLVGTDNAKTVTLATSDADYGAWVEGGFIELGKGTVVGFKWIPHLTRWVEISRTATVIS